MPLFANIANVSSQTVRGRKTNILATLLSHSYKRDIGIDLDVDRNRKSVIATSCKFEYFKKMIMQRRNTKTILYDSDNRFIIGGYGTWSFYDGSTEETGPIISIITISLVLRPKCI